MACHGRGIYEWIADRTSDRLVACVAEIGCEILKGQAQWLRVYMTSSYSIFTFDYSFVVLFMQGDSPEWNYD